MIGLGIDLCEIARIEATLAKGDALLRRFFAPEEREYLQKRNAVATQSAAAMFAAKEAFLKALGRGIDGGIPLSDVCVLHGASGRPEYQLTGAAREAFAQSGARAAHLSLTHEAGLAAAVCVLE